VQRRAIWAAFLLIESPHFSNRSIENLILDITYVDACGTYIGLPYVVDVTYIGLPYVVDVAEVYFLVKKALSSCGLIDSICYNGRVYEKITGASASS
jgi:hypothetical protein